MKRVAVSFAVLVALATILTAAPAGAEPVLNESRFVVLINQLRASKGLGPLAPDPQLQSVARAWSGVMARTQTLAHNPDFPNQVTSDWLFLGENVGVGPTVDELHQAFINSPHHYENLVEPRFHLVGIGIVEVNGTIWVTENFEQRRAVATATAPVNQAVARPPSAPRRAPAAAAAPKAAPAPTAPTVPATTAPALAPSNDAAPPADQPMAVAEDDRRGLSMSAAEVEGVAFDRGRRPAVIALWGAGPLMALVLALVVITRRRRRRRPSHAIKI